MKIAERDWSVSKRDLNSLNKDWWEVAVFTEGRLFMNNNSGEMILVSPNGEVYETYF